jgi:hypothetical protein
MIPKVIEPPAHPDRDRNGSLAPSGPPTRKWASSWLATTMILACAACALLLVVGIQLFGSTASTLAYLRGDPLIPDSYTKSFGTASEDERPSVAFRLMNCTKQTITILGSNVSCTCIIPSNTPLAVPPGGSAILRVSVRSKAGNRRIAERLRLLTDAGGTSLVLGVQGAFR